MAATFGIIHASTAHSRAVRKDGRDRPSDGGKGLPPGQISHVAGPSDGAFMSLHLGLGALWVKFRDETLVPGLATVENGPPEPPRRPPSRSTARCPSEWAPVFQIGATGCRAGLAVLTNPGRRVDSWASAFSRSGGGLAHLGFARRAPMMVGEVLLLSAGPPLVHVGNRCRAS